MKKSKDNLIHIGKDYAFQISKSDITLFKCRITEKGEAHFDTIGYYTSLEAMYFRLIETGLAGLENLQDIANRQIELKKWISAALQELAKNTFGFADKHKSMLAIPKQGAKN